MTAPILLAFCSPADRERVIEASFGFGGFYFAGDPIDLSKERLALLAIGPEGGAELAQWIEAHGLDGITGIGLVGVTAPWAERGACYGEWLGGSGGHKVWKRCYTPSDYVSSFDPDDADPEPLCQKHFDALNPSVRDMWKPARVLLGNLEPLRGVAERARRYCRCDGSRTFRNGRCSLCGSPRYLCFVIACAPDDGVCATCHASGGVKREMYGPTAAYVCPACSGSGKAISSAEVASELTGINPPQVEPGHVARVRGRGMSVCWYGTSVALDEHGLRAVVERLMQ